MNHLQIIIITDIHKEDAFYKRNPVGQVFVINNHSTVTPSREGKGFISLQDIEAISKKFKGVTCFYAVKYKILSGVQE